MNANGKGSVYAREEIVIQGTPQEVWRVLTTVDLWRSWNPQVKESRSEGPLDVGSRFLWKSGGMAIRSTVEALEPHRGIEWTGSSMGAHVRHRWELEPGPSQTVLTTEETMEGWLPRLVGVLVPGFLSKSLRAWLIALKAEVEGRGAEAPVSAAAALILGSKSDHAASA